MNEIPPELGESMRLLQKILQYGIEGLGPLSGAVDLADEYLADPSYTDNYHRICALAKTESFKNFSTGFVTSLGGLITLPVAIPASLSLNWIIQTRMVAGMAHIGGFDISEPGVRVTIALSILGKRGKELVNTHPGELADLLKKNSLAFFPRKTILALNQSIASKLVQLATRKGFFRLSKAIPFLGGVVGGFLDYQSCRETTGFAKELFSFDSKQKQDSQPEFSSNTHDDSPEKT